MPVRIRVSIPDLRATLQAFDRLDDDAQGFIRDEVQDIAQGLADKIVAFAQSDSAQSARAATTVQAVRDRVPIVRAGARGTRKARALVLGSEFGATKKFGWYRRARYYNSPEKQFRPHRGSASYWFFKTYEANRDEVVEQYVTKMDAILRRWGVGD